MGEIPVRHHLRTGAVFSPLLANLYLHYVLDKWFEQEVRPRLTGRCQLVRYADDAVMLFENEQDGQRVLAALGTTGPVWAEAPSGQDGVPRLPTAARRAGMPRDF